MARVVAVACSGGRDSLALLHATARACAGTDVRVLALHVHHGLLPEADAWWRHVEGVCAHWTDQGLPVGFMGHRVTTSPAAGDSVEAWARAVRYDALDRLATDAGAEAVLLAHHRRDQAETFLLQALRGAGSAGLAGMARRFHHRPGGPPFVRPWLDHPREAVEAYVAAHGLDAVDDPSNGDPRFARNRLRAQVWPALVAAFPEAEVALSAAAHKAAQADEACEDLAAQDLAACADGSRLHVGAWATLGAARRVHLLRHWLRAGHGVRAPAALLRRLHDELDRPGPATWQVPGGVLRRYRGRVAFSRDVAPPSPQGREAVLALDGPGTHRLPGWGGCLVARPAESHGVPVAWLARLELRARTGGETFQPAPGRPPRALKKQFQAAGVPEWLRDGPLVYSGGLLVFVPGLGIDARVMGLPGQPQLLLDWQPLDVTEA